MKSNRYRLKQLYDLIGPDFPNISTIRFSNELLVSVFGPDYFSILTQIGNKYIFFGPFLFAAKSPISPQEVSSKPAEKNGFVVNQQIIAKIYNEEKIKYEERIAKIFITCVYGIGLLVILGLIFLANDNVYEWIERMSCWQK